MSRWTEAGMSAYLVERLPGPTVRPAPREHPLTVAQGSRSATWITGDSRCASGMNFRNGSEYMSDAIFVSVFLASVGLSGEALPPGKVLPSASYLIEPICRGRRSLRSPVGVRQSRERAMRDQP